PVVAGDYDEVMSILDYTDGNQLAMHPAADSERRTGNVSLLICDVKTKSLINREHYVLAKLRQACARGGFEYYYQPVYRVTGEFSGFAECLLRLRDDDHGVYISPYEFIPIAEKYGLIGIIGDYVLGASCALVRKFIDSGMTPPVLSVNFSARQFYDVTMPENVMKCIRQHDIPASCIKIEITESYLITNYDQVREIMDELVGQGVGFFLDDFGSGFSNIPRYINLPFECIKYDHSLLKSSETNPKTDRLLKAMTPNFISLGYKIVFEGVEKEDNLSYVSSFGDVYVQGYYFSYAVPEKRFCAMLGLEC
ncbi:MAG: EAL domain-containing protein, partial [Bullifex sp.]